MAALTHGDEPFAGDREIEQQRACRQRFDFRRLVGRIVGIELRSVTLVAMPPCRQRRDQREAESDASCRNPRRFFCCSKTKRAG